MSHKIIVYMAAVSDQNLPPMDKREMTLHLNQGDISVNPASLADVGIPMEVENLKSVVCERIDKLAAAARPKREEQASSDPKILAGRVPPQPGLPGLPGVKGLPPVEGIGRKSRMR